MKRLRPNIGNKGMALLITIMVISLLIAVTVQFNRNVRDHFFTSAAQLDGQHLRVIARSGVAIGEVILEANRKLREFDTLQDSWATLTDELFADSFPRGTLHMEIEDMSGRLQVNSLVQNESGQNPEQGENNASDNKEILKRLLLSGRFQIEDENEAQEIIDSLVDWLDADDRESDFGAESSYYRSLEIPYECRNGPVTALEDLLLVRGMTADLLYGNNSHAGLADFITAYGSDGKININTAPTELLEAMHSLMTEELAQVMAEYRLEEANLENLENSNWYRSVPAWPGEIEFSDKIMTTKSTYFQIMAEGIYHDQKRKLTVVVARDKEGGISQIHRRIE